jgi:choloylglycine hydrolase
VSTNAYPCTRIVYSGTESLYIVGRSLDWKTPIPTNLYVYPQGVTKLSSDLPDAIKWKSKYGAIYAVSYDGGVTEGMNEMGLVINGLFCNNTVYNKENTTEMKPMSLAMFVAWMLDLNATTDEVITALNHRNFNIIGATFDSGTVSALHWGITDASGNTAIIEFDNGNLKIYQSGHTEAMTNDPPWPSMTAIVDYWTNIGGQHALPGTVSSPDRCVRAEYFVNHVEKTNNADLGISIAKSILYNSSVPYSYTIDNEPNLSSTQWRSFANTRDGLYYFDIVTNFGIYYINLNECNLTEGSAILKLDTSLITDKLGDITPYLSVSKPFLPMY